MGMYSSLINIVFLLIHLRLSLVDFIIFLKTRDFVKHQIEDEFLFNLICPFYTEIRKMYEKYYYINPSAFKVVQLFSIKITNELCNLGKYFYKCSKLRQKISYYFCFVFRNSSLYVYHCHNNTVINSIIILQTNFKIVIIYIITYFCKTYLCF